MALSGSSLVFFGLLELVSGAEAFFLLSVLLRGAGAVGNCAYLTGAFGLIATVFQAHRGAMFGWMETFCGLGMIVGPTVGGLLYEAGGFLAAFAALGGLLAVAATFAAAVLPDPPEVAAQESDEEADPKASEAVRVPRVVISLYKYG